MTLIDAAPAAATAVVDAASGDTLTYTQLRERSRALLEPLGGQRRLVFLLADNDLFSVLAYAGALAAPHPVALFDARTATDDLAALLRAYRPHWVAGPTGTAQRLVGAGVEVDQVVQSEGGELVRHGGAVDTQAHPDLAAMLTTSGTTGSRKLVRLSASNVESNARSIAELLSLTPAERPVTSLPIHYSFGLSVLNSHWAAGAAVVLTNESVMQKPFWALVSDHGATSVAGVPFTFQLLERAGFRAMDLPSLTTLQQAGGALDQRLTRLYAEHMAARGGRLVVMYGQTEATARIAYVPPERLLDKLGAAGIAVPGGRLEVDAPTQDPVTGAAVGEVVYTGPNVMMGYALDRDDLSRGDELGGRLRTGDLGRIDDEGYLFLSGRIGRVAKVFGLRVDLDDVESALREGGPAVAVGGPDVIWGFCAFGTEQSLADDARRLAKRYRIHHGAVLLRRVDEIPTTSSGKVDYEQVRRWTT